MSVCLRSVGTSRVSHFLSTIKVNELFRLCFFFFFFALVQVSLAEHIVQKS